MIDPELAQRFDNLAHLFDTVAVSLGHEIGDVKAIVERFSARLDKIAAGTHYVARLADWSEKQDKFQAEILDRVRSLEARIVELEKRE